MIGETSDVGPVIASSLSLNVLVYTHASVGVFTRTQPLFPILPGGSVDSTLLQMEPSLMPGCGFPRIKGRTNLSLFFLFDYLMEVRLFQS
jgi:hypothetical protein